MLSIHPSVGRVTTVRHAMKRRGSKSYAHFISDLIFVGRIPMIVVEWSTHWDGDRPKVTVPLDPKRLHTFGRKEAEYLYESSVEDPRVRD